MKTLFNNKYFIFFITLVLFFLGSLFQIIPIEILNIDTANISNQTKVILNLFSNLIITIILIMIYYKSIKKDFIAFKKNFSELFETSFQIWVIGLILMASSNLIINQFSPNQIANNEEAIRSMINISPILMLLNTAIMAPIIEELVFRKSFRIIFKNGLAFVLISGIVFGSLHVITSIKNVYDYLYILPYCSLGIAFSYIYYKTDNICAPIFMHFLHNAIMTVMNILAMGMIL